MLTKKLWLLDDGLKSHWTEILKLGHARGERGFDTSNTKINRPNDQTINWLVEQSINKKLRAWCSDRRKADSEGKAVPCSPKEVLTAGRPHGKHRFKYNNMVWCERVVVPAMLGSGILP